MKWISPILILLFFSSFLFSQTTTSTNIVPNASFEQYSGTPLGWFYKGKYFTNVMKYWSSPTNASPDAFGPKINVPSQWAEKGFGEQRAQEGQSMAGITVYGCKEGKPHCREYVQIRLTEPLVPQQKYSLTFWVSHLPRSLQINNLGAAFTNTKVNEMTDMALEIEPVVYESQIINATYWKKLQFEFKAIDAFEFLILGNFHTDEETKTRTFVKEPLNFAYYYLDNIHLVKQQPIIDVPIASDDLCCIEIEPGKVFRLKHIYFDTDKAELLPRSFVELNKLVARLKEKPYLNIEILGHTDNQGDDQYNNLLSLKRAKAVVEYLHQKGIAPTRTGYKGYGASKPIASNKSVEGRSLNRRVEFVLTDKSDMQ